MFLSQLSALSLSQNDFILLIPMALAGMVLSGAVPCHTRIAHYSFEVVGAVLGVAFALMLLIELPRLL